MVLTFILEVYLRLSFPLDFLYRLASTSDHKTSVLQHMMWYMGKKSPYFKLSEYIP